MKEEKYYEILTTYKKGIVFELTTNRGNGDIKNLVCIDYMPAEKGEEIPMLRFMDGGEIFNPESIGGVERIVSLETVSQEC
jgi:hypothetical protein